jgi:hypothetical protein
MQKQKSTHGPIFGYLGPRSFPELLGGRIILIHMSDINIKSNTIESDSTQV